MTLFPSGKSQFFVGQVPLFFSMTMHHFLSSFPSLVLPGIRE